MENLARLAVPVSREIVGSPGSPAPPARTVKKVLPAREGQPVRTVVMGATGLRAPLAPKVLPGQ